MRFICENCFEPFEKLSNRGKKPRFCCEVCRREWWMKNASKSNRTKHIKRCESCGNNYETLNRYQQYCSISCKVLAGRGRTTYEKICLGCNSNFKTTQKDNKYCSSACASRDIGKKRRKYKTCKYCGNEFYTDHFNRSIYCSRDCSNNDKYGTIEYRLQRKQHKAEQKKKESEKTKECLWCHKSFVTTFHKKNCCSKVCSYEHKKLLDRQQWALNYTPRRFVCAECSSDFVTNLGEHKTIYCSTQCAERYNKKREKAIYGNKYSKENKKRRAQQIKENYVAPVKYQEIYKRDKGILRRPPFSRQVKLTDFSVSLRIA